MNAPKRFELEYHRNAERPVAKLWLFDDADALIDLSSSTFTLRIGQLGAAATVTKTTNMTGATGSGTSPTGTPNLTITWTAGELDITPGVYEVTLITTASGVDRVFGGSITILDVVSA